MRANFGVSATLSTVVDTSGGLHTQYNATLRIVDNSGAFTGTDLRIGDYVLVDTGAYESGSVTLYEVTLITSSSINNVNVKLAYHAANDNALGAPDLTFAVGTKALAVRPTTTLGMSPVAPVSIQRVSESLVTAALNLNFSRTLDGVTTAPVLTAASNLIAGQVVRYSAGGLLPANTLAMSNLDGVLGVVPDVCNIGDSTSYVTRGETVTIAGASFNPGDVYFLTPTGALSTVAEHAGAVAIVRVGTASTVNQLAVELTIFEL